MRGDARLGAVCLTLVLALASLSQAGPVNRASRMLSAERLGSEHISEKIGEEDELLVEHGRNTTIDGGCIFGVKTYVFGENVPSLKPCETCTCTENGVQCSPIICEVRPGCKALHRADLCCPIYQCECERNGVTYSNGEKLIDPQNPCQVCYCQGGEIVCNKIACFQRDDCEPRYVEGRCCPEYDHCPPREKNSPALDLDKKTTNTDSSSEENVSSNEDVSPSRSSNDISNKDEPEISSGDKSSIEVTNGETLISKPIVISLNTSNNSNKNKSTLNIKEVTNVFEKPINNEIRIKEILPDVSSSYGIIDQAKSPTIPREALYNDKIEDSRGVEANFENDSKNETEDNNLNAYQPPPILRIGDQLVFLENGGLVPENSTVNTPAPIITVFGAEGLQRVTDEPEETFESKYIKEDEYQRDAPVNEILKNEETSQANDGSASSLIIKSLLGLFSIDSAENKTSQQSVIDTSQTSSEDPDQILQEVISKLYETTTIESVETPIEQDEQIKNSNEVLKNHVRKNFELDSSSIETDSSNETVDSYDSTTNEPQNTPEKVIDMINDDPQVLIEHLPEHNPEYPLLPEDIMILMAEDTSDTASSEADFNMPSPISTQETKDNEKIIIARKPLSTNNIFSNRVNNDVLTDREKILPDVLQLVRRNKTDPADNSTALIPEEWLKATENVNSELDSPLINLNSTIPDNILLFPTNKESVEEDDSEDYIFINNYTANSDVEPSLIIKQELLSTDEPVTDIYELKPEVRSPGEPLLIPEWERNQTNTTENSADSISILTIDNGDDLSELNINKNISNNTSSEEEISTESIFNNQNQDNNFESNSEINHIEKNAEISDENISVQNVVGSSANNLQTQEDASKNSDVKDDTEENQTNTPLNEETLTNFIISTEDSVSYTSTKNPPPKALPEIETKDSLENEKVMLVDDLLPYDSHTKKQKKAPSLTAIKNDNSNDSEKQGNILSDLISLVGDVANIGNHDVEVSTVHNSIEVEKHTMVPPKSTKNVPKKNDKTTMGNFMVTDAGLPLVSANLELSEYTSEEKIDDIPLENEKVEFTTKRMYIDKDGDERTMWKSTDHLVKDIEIVPKEKKIKDSSMQKIVDSKLEDKSVSEESVESISDPVLIELTTTTTTKSPINTMNVSIKQNVADKKDDSKLTTAPVTTIFSPKLVKDIYENDFNKENSLNFNLSESDSTSQEKSLVNTLETISEEQTESTDPTVMKVSIKSDPSTFDKVSEDKLTKRETNSQLRDSSGQIDESLISILRDFFEKQYGH